ncbi:MAG: hypothetical protein JNM17_09525 [Archangium sp.]|nr:hypothetical protein [Archangium sp.]
MRRVLLILSSLCITACPGIVGGDDSGTGGGTGGGGANTGGGTAGGGGLSCATGTHECSATCVPDDAITSCGSSCTPCSAPMDATATCTGGACGFTCNAGFEPCLGRCIIADAGTCPVNLAANTFARLTSGDVGTRMQAALIYLPSTSEYVLVGGARTHDPQPYDVQALTLGETAWRNAYPPGQNWGPMTGNSMAPDFATESFEQQDRSGFPRPSFEVYGGTTSFQQTAWLGPQTRLLFYLWNRTFSYDAVARAWTFHAPTTDPAGGPMQPRLMWGAMTANAAGTKVLLFGGANVHTDAGTPGTWIYDVPGNTWRQLALATEPPQRSYPSLSTDPERDQALLFGGDQLDQLLSDTWTFDFATEQWTEHTPPVSPTPRGGHRLLYLPGARTTVLLGGFTSSSTTDYVASPYSSLPMELWRFDFASHTWALIKRFAPMTAPSLGPSPTNAGFTFGAAVGSGDVAVLHIKNGYPDDQARGETWAIRIDPSVTDTAGTTMYGATPGTVTRRGDRYDPAWFSDAGVPDAGELASISARITGAADNVWVSVPSPNRPATNHDWGTAAFNGDDGQLLRWSGGHSAWSGTDVLQYTIDQNRFSIGYRPELPFERTFTNDQMPGHWSPKGRPWMAVHTYKMYTYSRALRRMVIYKNPYTFFYDASASVMEFDLTRVRQELGGNQYVNTLVEIPTGVLAWTPDGLFKLESRSGPWVELMPTAMGGAALPQMGPDNQTAVYEPSGDRVLFISSVGNAKGEVFEYSLANNTLRALNPAGKADMAANMSGFIRESALMPGTSLILCAIGFQTPADVTAGVTRVPVYDAMNNRWSAWRLNMQSYGNSFAVVSDPARARIWGLGQNNQVFLLKLNAATADIETLN